MSKMFTGSGRLFQEVQSLPMDDESLQDIERRIKIQPHFLGEPLVIIGEAADFPQVLTPDTHDLVGLDAMGRAVVVSLCMGVADTEQDIRALQLAAFLSSLSSEDLGKIARSFISRPANDGLRRAWEEMGVEMSDEAVELSSLLASAFDRDAEDYAESTNAEQRIIITSEEFSSRLVNVIQWLVEGGIGIVGLKYNRFLVGGQEVFSAEQIVPRIDPAVDAPEQSPGHKQVESAEPWRVKGRAYHVERLSPAVGNLLDRLLLLIKPATFTINYSHKYYFWVRGAKRNIRVRTYYRDRLELGFYNTTQKAVEEYLARYKIQAEVNTVGGYTDSPFVGLTSDMTFDEKWGRMLCDWLNGAAIEENI
ncbi:MAG: hypothetical protein JXR97_10140 [Planctomycetes bacterium]|nr:hypothetical protein [Planctomycetota bacterium]